MWLKYKSVTIKTGPTSGFWPLVVKKKHPLLIIKGQILRFSLVFSGSIQRKSLWEKYFCVCFPFFFKTFFFNLQLFNKLINTFMIYLYMAHYRNWFCLWDLASWEEVHSVWDFPLLPPFLGFLSLMKSCIWLLNFSIETISQVNLRCIWIITALYPSIYTWINDFWRVPR